MANTASSIDETARKGYTQAQDMLGKSVKAWSDLVATSTDMAYDVVLKNWNYSRSVRNSTEQAVEDAINAQSRFVKEMMGVFHGYSESFQEIIGKTTK